MTYRELDGRRGQPAGYPRDLGVARPVLGPSPPRALPSLGAEAIEDVSGSAARHRGSDRIEFGEVEAALASHPSVNEAVADFAVVGRCYHKQLALLHFLQLTIILIFGIVKIAGEQGCMFVSAMGTASPNCVSLR